MFFFRSAVLLCAALAMAACSSVNSKSFSISDGKGELVDARWRTIISRDGKTCAEPSPDALVAVASAFSANGSFINPGSQEIAAALSASQTESAASIGLRTQSIQLLRDAYYRLCEADLNGTIDQQTFDILQRRFQNHMIALLAVEQLTGAVKASQVGISGSSEADGGAQLGQLRGQLSRAREERQVLKEDETNLQTLIDETDDAEDKKTLGEKKQAVTDDIADLDEEIKALNAAFREAAKKTAKAETRGSVQIEAVRQRSVALGQVANAVADITKTAITTDYAGQMCFAYLRDKKLGAHDDVLREYCYNLLREDFGVIAANRQTIEVNNANISEVNRANIETSRNQLLESIETSRSLRRDLGVLVDGTRNRYLTGTDLRGLMAIRSGIVLPAEVEEVVEVDQDEQGNGGEGNGDDEEPEMPEGEEQASSTAAMPTTMAAVMPSPVIPVVMPQVGGPVIMSVLPNTAAAALGANALALPPSKTEQDILALENQALRRALVGQADNAAEEGVSDDVIRDKIRMLQELLDKDAPLEK